MCAYTRAAGQSEAGIVPVTIDDVQLASGDAPRASARAHWQLPPRVVRSKCVFFSGAAHVRTHVHSKTKTTAGRPPLSRFGRDGSFDFIHLFKAHVRLYETCLT